MNSPLLFSEDDLPLDWRKEWVGMPEFEMGDTNPIQRITINFRSIDEVVAFATMIDRKITSKTDSVWFSNDAAYEAPKNFLYVDET